VIPFGGEVITNDIKMGCAILGHQAELLKTRFGSALAAENKENEVVCIPGLKGRDPKEISVKNLAHIIQCRMEEILEHVYFEIKNSGLEKQLTAGGIVLTGGGAQLKHLRQLTEYITGLSTRIGYPNEHLASSKVADITSPLYATGVGLVMRGFQHLDRTQARRPAAAAVRQSTEKPGVNTGGVLTTFWKRVIDSDIFSDDEK
jgi:cell division protein FtsA